MTRPKDSAPVAPRAPVEESRLVAIGSIQRTKVEYLDDEGLIPRGMVSLLVGDPGLGKSTYCCWATAQVTTAGAAVIYQTAEDSYTAVVRPRLEAAGADLNRVHYVELPDDAPIWLPTHVALLAGHVKDSGAALVIIDPLMAFLPDGVNSHKDQSIRTALRPLRDMAEQHGCTVLVAAHLNKTSGTDLHRISGSVGITGAARSVLLLGRNPDNPASPDRVLVHMKSNVGPEQKSQLWRIESVALEADQTQPETVTSRIRPLGASRFTSQDVLGHHSASEPTSALTDAIAFIEAELAHSPVEAKAMLERARAAGISERTLRRAADDLHLIKRKTGFGDDGKWRWALPTKDDQAGDGELAHLDRGPLSEKPDLPLNQADLGPPGKAPSHEDGHSWAVDVLADEEDEPPPMSALASHALNFIEESRRIGLLPHLDDDYWERLKSRLEATGGDDETMEKISAVIDSVLPPAAALRRAGAR